MSTIISESSPASITLDEVIIRRDQDGRYCLNDLHRASGGNEKDKPVHFLKLKSTESLIAAIRGIPTSDRINDLEPVKTVRSFSEEQGTFVVKELVYAYAMWISPAFHLKVIRTFDETASRPQTPVTVPVPLLPADVGRITIDCMMDVANKYGVPQSYAMQCAAGEATRQTGMPWDKLLTQAACMNDVPSEELYLEPTPLGQLFDISAVAMNKWLQAEGLQTKVGGMWEPTELGQPFAQRHAWVRGNQSGYNLKWKVTEIERRYHGLDQH